MKVTVGPETYRLISLKSLFVEVAVSAFHQLSEVRIKWRCERGVVEEAFANSYFYIKAYYRKIRKG